MKTALWPLQASLYNRLKNDTAVNGKANVYDAVPEGAAMPYVTIGEDTSVPDSTKTYDAEEITHTLHVYSSYNGKKEVKEIMSLVLEASTKESLTLSNGFIVEMAELDLMQVMEINGSPAKHGVIRMRFKIKQ